MSSGDGDSSSLLLGCFINHVVIHSFPLSIRFGKNLGDSSSEGRFSMLRNTKLANVVEKRGRRYIDVTDGTNIVMRELSSELSRLGGEDGSVR